MAKSGFDSFAGDVARRIRAMRVKAGLTLEDLAHEADLTSRHLHEIEKGRSNPTLRSLFNIASALGITVRDLLDEPDRRAARR